MSRGRILRAAVVASSLVTAAACARRLAAPSPAGTHEPARTIAMGSAAAQTGPRSLMQPPSAVTAKDSSDLQRLLDDPNGPKEIWLAPVVYFGDVVVRRSVAVRGAQGAVLEGSGKGTVVTIDATDVVLENVVVRGSGESPTKEDSGIRARGRGIRIEHVFVDGTLFGIALNECAACIVENSRVHGHERDASIRGDGVKLWESHDSVVRGNLIEGVRDVVVWYSRRTLLERNLVTNSRYGAHFMYAHDGVLKDSRIVGNVVGVFVMYSARLRADGNVFAGARGPAGIGIGFKESDGVSLHGNRVVGNTTGVYLDRTPRSESEPVRFDGNLIALNDVATRFHSSQRGLSFRGNEFRDNAVVVEIEGGGNAMAVEFRGNRWSDYAGYDLDGNGVGDVPFLVKRLSSELADAHPAIRFFQGTVAMAMVDAVARALPFMSAAPILTDEAPRMRPLPGIETL